MQNLKACIKWTRVEANKIILVTDFLCVPAFSGTGSLFKANYFMNHFFLLTNTVLPLSNYFRKCYYRFTVLCFILHIIYLWGGGVSQRTICKSQVSPSTSWVPEMILSCQACLEALFFFCWALSLACSVIFGNTFQVNFTKSCLHSLSSCLSNGKVHVLRMKSPIPSLPATSLVIHVNFVLHAQAKNLSTLLSLVVLKVHQLGLSVLSIPSNASGT